MFRVLLQHAVVLLRFGVADSHRWYVPVSGTLDAPIAVTSSGHHELERVVNILHTEPCVLRELMWGLMT